MVGVCLKMDLIFTIMVCAFQVRPLVHQDALYSEYEATLAVFQALRNYPLLTEPGRESDHSYSCDHRLSMQPASHIADILSVPDTWKLAWILTIALEDAIGNFSCHD